MSPSPLPLTLIVAATTSNAIGLGSTLPWRLSKEMAYFAKVTKGAAAGGGAPPATHAVIMGRKSWEGIPARFRPLEGRINVVVSRQSDYDLSSAPLTSLASSLPAAVSILENLPSSTLGHTFLIGGAQLYSHALATPSSLYTADRILLTRVKSEYAGDVYFPVLEPSVWTRATHAELSSWVGFDVPEGDQVEVDRNDKGKREVTYEFQMWVRGHSGTAARS